MGLTLLSECLAVSVEAPEGSHDVLLPDAKLRPRRTEGCGVGRFFGTEAAVAATMIGRAERAAAGVRHGAKTGRSVRHHDAGRPASLALSAYTVRGRIRFAPIQVCAENLDKLVLIDRAAAQLEIHEDVVGNGRRFVQRFDVTRCGVHNRNEFFDVLEVAEGLNASGGGARANRHQKLRGTPYLVYSFGVMGCGDGAFNQRYIIWPFDHRPRRFREVRDLDSVRNCQEFVLAVEQAELAAVARGELPDCYLGFTFLCHLRFPILPASRGCACTGTQGHPCRRTPARTGSARTGRWHISCYVPWTG